MSTKPKNDAPARESTPGVERAGNGVLALFTLTTFVSACLLFSVQPLFAKMVLPVLGGAPSVWAVALCFFQAALLAGYCYAHLLIRYVPMALTGFVHLALTILAVLFLPIALPAGAMEPPPGDAYWWQLEMFALAIGVPFVAVSANAPLLQAWFARAGHAQSADPYFLYAASNLGSFLALFSYPLLLEPLFGLSRLSTMWSVGFGVLIALIAACFLIVRRTLPPTPGGSHVATSETPESADWRQIARWIFLAFVPAALLTAFTTHIATDVASAPLIWVLPLALYLLSFVVVFRERALIPPRVLLAIHLVATVSVLIHLSQIKHDTWYLAAALGALAFFASTLVAHRTLYESRPPASGLTAFYLYMSLGGALGGVFASLVAPKIFPEVYEYPLLLALTFACRPGSLSLPDDSAGRQRLALTVAACAALIAGIPMSQKAGLDFGAWGGTFFIALGLGLIALLAWAAPVRQLAAALALFVAVSILPSSVHRGEAERSYFGVYRVVLSEDGDFNVLQHGTTLHGAQRIRDETSKPAQVTTPCTYYHPRGPMAQAIGMTRLRFAEEGRPMRVGVVGLGAGALACHSDPSESWRFFEIDPVVERIAKSDHFTYLSACQPKADVVIGDARLTLAKENDESFDVLVVDAFSSDAIPMHLITREALQLYASKLSPSGIGVLHVSNRYLDLESVLSATLPQVPGVRAFAIDDPSPSQGYAVTPSSVVFIGKDQRTLHAFLRMRGTRTLNYSSLKPWTDDASDILGPFLVRWRRHG